MAARLAQDLGTLRRLVDRGHGAGLYGRLADYEAVALAAVVLELVHGRIPQPHQPFEVCTDTYGTCPRCAVTPERKEA